MIKAGHLKQIQGYDNKVSWQIIRFFSTKNKKKWSIYHHKIIVKIGFEQKINNSIENDVKLEIRLFVLKTPHWS